MKIELIKSQSIATFGIDIEEGAVIIKFLKWNLWIESNKLCYWFQKESAIENENRI